MRICALTVLKIEWATKKKQKQTEQVFIWKFTEKKKQKKKNNRTCEDIASQMMRASCKQHILGCWAARLTINLNCMLCTFPPEFDHFYYLPIVVVFLSHTINADFLHNFCEKQMTKSAKSYHGAHIYERIFNSSCIVTLKAIESAIPFSFNAYISLT